ncbi:MAG: ABC transporter substrate-binding protein [Deltaproteobacteria bacterium]|nr:ABC transporter substrate-binding protein [Deltaproteobacteria bacterium]MBN2672335.1 ABC transporter substrate-binding protein [Deltaproteobacteria bacterium]
MTKKTAHLIGRPAVLVCLFAVWMISCIDVPENGVDGDTVKIGALLPFTGDLAASGANIEKTLIWVTEQINENGGLAGRPVELITKDTNSDVVQGMSAARQLIEEEGVVAIVGPEYADLALRMMPLIAQNDVVQVSGGVSSTAFTSLDQKELWFRTCPSSLTLGSVLAQRIVNDGVHAPLILHVNDEYGTNFSDMLSMELTEYLDETPIQIGFKSGLQSYRTILRLALDHSPDAIVLVAYPKTGATIIADWSAMGGDQRLYFSDSLDNEVFLQNVPPGSIDGMTGVAHADSSDTAVFAGQFEERWPGEQPLLSSYYNYDALSILALAIEEAYVESGSTAIPSAQEIATHILNVSSNSTGKKVAWYELEYGLHLLRNKDVAAYAGINYRGASGFVELDEHGEIFSGLAKLWTVLDGQIVYGENVAGLPVSTQVEE